MKYSHIISCDLDGTLLVKGKLSPENSRAISEMKKRNICFVANSGRTIAEMPKAVLEHPDIRYYIGADGALIWDKETDTYIENTMSHDEFAPLFDLISSYGTVNIVCTSHHSYTDVAKYTPEIYKENRVSAAYSAFIDWYVTKIEGYDDFARGIDSAELICVFFKTDAELNDCAEKANAMGHFTVSSCEPTNLEIYSKKAGKGNSLLTLANMLGVPLENTIAVGDSKNDMDMIRKAGISLAMSNACDELKAVASKIVCSCEEHIAVYILSMLSGSDGN